MRNDCTVGKLSERNEAGDEEAIRRRNRSCISRVGVVCPESESEMDGPLTDTTDHMSRILGNEDGYDEGRHEDDNKDESVESGDEDVSH